MRKNAPLRPVAIPGKVCYNFSVKHNIISDDFANLGEAYKDYGFAYCFTNSIIDNGIDEPEDYSKETVIELKAELDTAEVEELRSKGIYLK